MMKTVYQTDSSGIFIGETIARESPLEPGVYLIPFGCVEETPPSAIGHAAVYVNNAWSLIEDHRGETWYQGKTPTIIQFLGDPSLEGFTASMPDPSLEEQFAAIEADFELKKNALTARLTTIKLIARTEEAAKTAAIQTEYSQLCEDKAAAIEALLLGGL